MGVAVAVAVFAVFVGIRVANSAGSPIKGAGVRIVFNASALDTQSSPSASIGRSVEILRQRLDSVFRGVRVSRRGDRIVVLLKDAPGASRARVLALAAPARVAIYDWEANVLTLDSRTVASQLHRPTPTALEISQGTGSAEPGGPGSGSLSLYDAVKLASRQPTHHSPGNSRPWPEYYMFGDPGSAACAARARSQSGVSKPGSHCLLSGPDSDRQELLPSLPVGFSPSHAQVLVVPPGTVVLQALNQNANRPTRSTDRSAQFYVLRDHRSLSGNDITHPRPSTDPTGNPGVQFDLTSNGTTLLHNVVSVLAHRGERISRSSQQLDQHFAMAVDNQLIEVPAIDFKTYPNGPPVDAGVDIFGAFTDQTAQDLAILLRFGPLPVSLSTR